MSALKFTKHEVIALKGHPDFSEMWVRDRILEDPSILGFGDVIVKDVERVQFKAGRLDLLLQDSEEDRRYEVELMLGALDESHVIRAIEYWDIENTRYPGYDHCAVIVAEDVTTRFLNVIRLFNRTIPIIVLKMSALKVGDQVILQFTKVLDEIQRAEDEEDEDAGPVTDRAYWEERASEASVGIADVCLEILRDVDPSIVLTYKKHYIGLAINGRPTNFAVFRAKKQFVRVNARIRNKESMEEWKRKLEEAGLTILPGGSVKWIRFRLTSAETEEHRDLLRNLFGTCYRERQEA